MGDELQWLLGEIKTQNEARERLKRSNSKCDQLLYCLCYEKPKTKEGWFVLRESVAAFLKSDHPEAEKQKLMQYTEMLVMITSGYEYMEE